MRFDDDPVLQRMERLAVIAADRDRSQEVRLRCRRVLRENRIDLERDGAPRRARGIAFDYGLTYGLCAAYFLGLVIDVLRLYLLR